MNRKTKDFLSQNNSAIKPVKMGEDTENSFKF